ncbi:MAG TPA: histidine kinase [Actinospica sp.]|nr:histidine kinase [Actinospica sp.]
MSGPTRRAGDDVPQPRLARRILLIVLCSYVFIGVINLRLDNPGNWSRFWWPVACMAVVFGLQLTHISADAPGWPVTRKTVSLTAQAVATYLPFIALHEIWGGMAGFLAGSFLLLFRRPLAWVYFSLTVASMYFFAAHYYQDSANWIGYYVVATMLLGLITFGMTRLAQLVEELYAMRGELAQLAVTGERLRFARDLHDLLGYSLSSITLKSELTYRLVQKQPERAQAELAEILEISRQALADVREVSSSYRQMSLAAEAASARGILEAAEIDTEVAISCGPLPPALDTVLATTLREGVTNMLRHSKVQRCIITATETDGRILLELANDGVADPSADVFAESGSGLANLRTRLAAVGGTLAAGAGPGRMFRLSAQVPRARDGSGTGGVGGHGDQAAAG